MKPFEACNCAQGDSNIQNLGGHEGCGKGLARPINGILAPMKTVAGDDNGIIVGTDTPGQAFFDTKFKDEIASDRWLLLEGFLTDYDSPVVDPNVEEIPDGRTFVLNKNTKEVTTSIITDEYSTLAAKIESHICRDMGWMFEDENHSLIGHLKTATLFTFRKIQQGSFRVDTIEPTTSTKGRVQLRWKWDATALDTQVDYFTQEAMGGYSITNDTEALIDGNLINLVVGLTESTFRIENDYGGVDERIGLGGLDETHLEVFNVTDSIVIPVTGITTPTNILGDYTATYVGALLAGKTVRIQPIGTAISAGLTIQRDYDLKNIANLEVVSA